VWSQTIPLFKNPHLKNVATACFLQFAVCLTANGFWTFFPETLNKVFLWLDSEYYETPATVCEITKTVLSNGTAIDDAPQCITKLQLTTFGNVAMLTVLYSIFWLVISIVIVRTGRLLVLVSVFFTCAAASIAMMFVKIPMLSIYLYLVMLLAGLNMSIINTSTCELIPTNLRQVFILVLQYQST
jgi:hypothetical protein